MSKKNLLKEELKRHMQLLEYTFYVPEEDGEDDDVDNLLLGADTLYEQDPVPGEEEPAEDPFAAPDALDTPPVDAGLETPSVEDPLATTPEGEEVATDVEVDPFVTPEEGMEIEDEFATEEPIGDETVEVDVTDIVDKAEETRTEIEGLTSKMEELMGNFSELSDQVSGMDQVIDKIDGLEKEIERRNPTPVEKLEMRSMDSFPYSVKLTDFWEDKEGYEVGEETEEEEYVITKNEVDEYSEREIKDSFNYDSNDENYSELPED
jgi:hypothetical protein